MQMQHMPQEVEHYTGSVNTLQSGAQDHSGNVSVHPGPLCFQKSVLGTVNECVACNTGCLMLCLEEAVSM